MRCDQVQRLLDALVDGELRPWVAWRVRQHLHGCRDCAHGLAGARGLTARMREWRTVPLPASLRERVMAAVREMPEGPAGTTSPAISPVRRADRRGIVLGSGVLVAVSVALFLFVVRESPAGQLEKTMAAMARVRTAEATGWVETYRDVRESGKVVPGRMSRHLRYAAPDRFRLDDGPQVAGSAVFAGTLLVVGPRATFRMKPHGSPGPVVPFDPVALRAQLSPLDFFTPGGMLQRAAAEGARVQIRRPATAGGTVSVEVRSSAADTRDRWQLQVDAATDRVVRCDWLREFRDGGVWRPEVRTLLDRFLYNQPIPARLFQPEPEQLPGPHLRGTGASGQ